MRRRNISTRMSFGLRLAAVVAGGLLLANCSSGRIDNKYGVSASTRVVEEGKPVPKGGGVYRVGKPYTIAGKVYVPEENTRYRAEGMASWYGSDFHGRYTANGEIFDMNSISAAHPTLPLPSYVRVTNLRNHRSLVVRVNDRGPYAHNRLIDLSVRSAKLLGFHGNGLAPVRVEYVGRAPIGGSDDRKLVATLRENGKPAGEPEAREVRVASNRPIAADVFDARPMSRVTPDNLQTEGADSADNTAQAQADQAPEERPAPAVSTASRTPTPRNFELASAPTVDSAPAAVSPVSAYAPVRYDPTVGVMSGRGLY